MALASSDPKVLFGNAKCFACLTPIQQLRDQTYLLASLTGFPTDKAGVSALLAASKCMACLTTPQLRAVKAYLIAISVGAATTQAGVRALETQARCVDCLTPHMQFQVQTYLLALAAGFPTTVAGVRTIQANAKCFSCYTKKEQLEVQVYILTLLVPNAPTTPAELMAAAKCFVACASGEILSSIETLLQGILTGTALGPCVTPSTPNLLSVSPFVGDPFTSLRVAWKQPTNTGSLIIGYNIFWGTTSGVYTNSAFQGVGLGGQYIITGLNAGTTYFVVVQAVSSVASCVSANSNERSSTTSGSSTCAAGVTFANAWAARVVANGGALPSAPTVNAIADFQCGLIADGLDTMMLGWNAFVPDNLIASITPQLRGTGTRDPWLNSNFVVGDLSVNGLTGNAANKTLASGMTPSLMYPAIGNAGFCLYVYNTTQTGTDGGVQNAGHSDLLLAAKFPDGNSYSRNGSSFLIGLVSKGNGFYSCQRVSNTDHKFFFANSLNPHAQIGATDVTNVGAISLAIIECGIFVLNADGAGANPCSDTISFAGWTLGLTAAQDALLFARVQTLRQALLGGFR